MISDHKQAFNKNSVKAYHNIKPTIPAKEREVLQLIKMYGPINGRQLDVKISGGHKRLSSLMAMGCIDIGYIAKDSVTGQSANYYMWISDKPKVEKVKAKKPKYIVPIKLAEYYDKAYIEGIKDALFWAGYKRVEIEACVKRVKECQK